MKAHEIAKVSLAGSHSLIEAIPLYILNSNQISQRDNSYSVFPITIFELLLYGVRYMNI